ncbi:Gfo/Idh/MocA family oxidoreductase [Altererythrobacter arenosus]|uniref:Gfo/Idh/MocA family oxidoreductase n=1 Tax=Altererythrobacter arenosus TaxID=3032592 RepID=A0ABY8FZ88_9SPHN|nr:Gfo/Idh/MocA family oxidoreductase [Altererythrobacter sp. CAU 1644]WFL78706.1 Gfo/Idh/MocA family oxidoreductase [Altererythrobacter sp. CAU 1644]
MKSADHIRVAQVGCGYWGKNLVRNFSELGVLASVTDREAAVQAAMSADFRVAGLSWAEVLRAPEIDAVSLATPAGEHASMAAEAIAAGKHVFVEKPLALCSREAERLIEQARLAGRILMVGHLLQYHPIFLRLKQMVDEGALGVINYIFSNRMSLGKFRTEENVLWSFAPHDVSMILSVLGEEPEIVTAQGAAFVSPGIADWVTMQMAFPGGARGHVQVSWASPYKEQRLVVLGDGGMAVFDDAETDWGRKLALYRHRIDKSGPVPTPLKSEVEFLEVERDEPLKAECRHFIEAIATKSPPQTDGNEGLRVLKVLERGEAALRMSLDQEGVES